ncbi:MAG: ABC transporter permease [Verrucomicrobia bacterium]|nr:ABC transporter permease [Verrucomicrobiota bacterium]MBV8640678.1 ABC transporter permease [Verrucomicrobiota bacterium]
MKSWLSQRAPASEARPYTEHCPVDISLKESTRSPSTPAETHRSHRGFVFLLQGGSLAVFTSVMIYFAIAAPGFLALSNIANVLEQSAILGVLSFGMTIVFIGGGSDVVTGGIDLSLANNLGLSAAVYSTLVRSGYSDAVALPLTLLTGLAVGSVNAFAVVGLNMLPLLATLTVMNICAGFELVLTQNTVVQATSPLLSAIADTGPFGVPNLAYFILFLAALLIFGIEHTPFGLRLYAVGAYRQAARAAGLRINRYLIATYLLSGLCGGIAATLSVALLSGSSTGSGEMLLPVVFAALLGVVFSRRLVPSISGTLLSVLFIGFLINGFQLTNVSSYWVNGVEGVLILLVVAATSLSRRGQS